jgi:rare lipoprotein A
MRRIVSPLFCCILMSAVAHTQNAGNVAAIKPTVPAASSSKKILFGTASYYADKFNGRKTANGEVYDHSKATAACNKLPLGTWIRVTNIRNKRTVVVRINDRLHPRMNRIVDLSRSSAEKLGYVKRGLTEVKIEVLGRKKPG